VISNPLEKRSIKTTDNGIKTVKLICKTYIYNSMLYRDHYR